jgi:hypothetical protein
MVGGGVRGKTVGTARGNTVQVGYIIKVHRPFIERFQENGGRTAENVDGLGMNGIMS